MRLLDKLIRSVNLIRELSLVVFCTAAIGASWFPNLFVGHHTWREQILKRLTASGGKLGIDHRYHLNNCITLSSKWMKIYLHTGGFRRRMSMKTKRLAERSSSAVNWNFLRINENLSREGSLLFYQTRLLLVTSSNF